MSNQAAYAVRAKIIGVLLKDARLAAGKSQKECAEAAGCSVGVYSAYEAGEKCPSLPELELLAFALDTPLKHFWGTQAKSEAAEQRAILPAATLIVLRNRIIGAQLRKARLAAKIRLKDLAGQIGVSGGRLSAYEMGETPISLPELEALVTRLSLSIEDLFEARGTVGEWDSAQRTYERFKHFDPELRDFISDPANENFLRLAKQLSDLPTKKLRAIAESLLDITY